MTVSDLIEKLQKLPKDLKVYGQEYVSLWSGDPDDTDMSYYRPSELTAVEMIKHETPWCPSDARRKDQRRTKFSDTTKIVVLR